MKSFLKKKDPNPEDDNDAPISPTDTAISSKFSFDDDDDEDEDDGNDDIAKSSTKKKSKKKSINKQQSQQVVGSEDGIKIKDATTKTTQSSESSNNPSSSRCCTCKRLICSTICLTLLAAISILTWRYGPWSKDSAQVELFTITSNTNCATNNNCCNGLASNCNLPVNEVMFPMVHAAHSSYENNFVGAHNNKGFEGALVMGYRALQLSTCLCEKFVTSAFLLDRDEEWGLGDSDLGFCDTKCLWGVRDPKDVLTNIKNFIETNKREVLIIELTMNEGSSSDLRKALRHSGLLDHVYHPADQYIIEEWPTLQQLIDDDTRILLFGSGDGMESCPAYDCDDRMLFAGDHFARTEADGSDLDSCAPASTYTAKQDEGGGSYGYFVMNHYEHNQMKIPSPRRARELNAYENLESRMESCGKGRLPNLLAVEFWDEGEVLDFVKIENSGKNREGGEYDTSGVSSGADEDGVDGEQGGLDEEYAGRRGLRSSGR